MGADWYLCSLLGVATIVFHALWIAIWRFDSDSAWYRGLHGVFPLLQALSIIPLVLGHQEACTSTLQCLLILSTLHHWTVSRRHIDETLSLHSTHFSTPTFGQVSRSAHAHISILHNNLGNEATWAEEALGKPVDRENWLWSYLKVKVGRQPPDMKRYYYMDIPVHDEIQVLDFWDIGDNHGQSEVVKGRWWTRLDGVLLLFTQEQPLYNFQVLHRKGVFGTAQIFLVETKTPKGPSARHNAEVIARSNGWHFMKEYHPDSKALLTRIAHSVRSKRLQHRET
ncbi:hypothetical protein BKA67DRAFT_533762 [Truncatella angustata]|uniref:Uncharacterized protein n=1 Tax=Truncatella angustata TaxID=152316 RepID=A0A9P8UUA1_9PEZI|nr:uncharacterized protein BKA67DRAFT_533762 [Truncatella angustata]KAH6658632.1 hypothetical protein BKA67DRAFT_533762 [Truncatella angustata]